jgi:hypothetical protein
MPIAAMTFFSHSNRPRHARVTARVGATLGTACPRHLASAIHLTPPPNVPHTRRGSSAPGSGFAIGGHSGYLEPMFEFCFPTKGGQRSRPPELAP